MTTNVISKKVFALKAQKSNGRFIVSGRRIQKDISITNYIKIYYTYLQQKQIDSVFGFALGHSPLYGGRSQSKGGLITKNHLEQLNDHGINLSLTMSNHYFTEAGYQASCSLLKKLHRKGNSITCTNNELAAHIRKDFPDFSLTASLIMGLDTLDKVQKAQKIYDHVVIPMDKNDNDDFLKSLPNKKRVILFGNASCAYNCPDRICYLSISKDFIGKTKVQKSACSKKTIKREPVPHLFFDIEKYERMGFQYFKLIPDSSPVFSALVQRFSMKASPERIK